MIFGHDFYTDLYEKSGGKTRFQPHFPHEKDTIYRLSPKLRKFLKLGIEAKVHL